MQMIISSPAIISLHPFDRESVDTTAIKIERCMANVTWWMAVNVLTLIDNVDGN